MARTAFGLRDGARQDCAGQWRLDGNPLDLGLPDLDTAQDAAQGEAAGAQSLLIGAAVIDGRIPNHWLPADLPSGTGACHNICFG